MDFDNGDTAEEMSWNEIRKIRDDIKDATTEMNRRWYDECPTGLVLEGRVSRVEQDIGEMKNDIKEIRKCQEETNKLLARVLPLPEDVEALREKDQRDTVMYLKIAVGGLLTIFTSLVVYLITKGGL